MALRSSLFRPIYQIDFDKIAIVLNHRNNRLQSMDMSKKLSIYLIQPHVWCHVCNTICKWLVPAHLTAAAALVDRFRRKVRNIRPFNYEYYTFPSYYDATKLSENLAVFIGNSSFPYVFFPFKAILANDIIFKCGQSYFILRVLQLKGSFLAMTFGCDSMIRCILNLHVGLLVQVL